MKGKKVETGKNKAFLAAMPVDALCRTLEQGGVSFLDRKIAFGKGFRKPE